MLKYYLTFCCLVYNAISIDFRFDALTAVKKLYLEENTDPKCNKSLKNFYFLNGCNLSCKCTFLGLKPRLIFYPDKIISMK